jgi:hypothetical protein
MKNKNKKWKWKRFDKTLVPERMFTDKIMFSYTPDELKNIEIEFNKTIELIKAIDKYCKKTKAKPNVDGIHYKCKEFLIDNFYLKENKKINEIKTKIESNIGNSEGEETVIEDYQKLGILISNFHLEDAIDKSEYSEAMGYLINIESDLKRKQKI